MHAVRPQVISKTTSLPILRFACRPPDSGGGSCNVVFEAHGGWVRDAVRASLSNESRGKRYSVEVRMSQQMALTEGLRE
ncbi:hypothetical protein PAXRUDRAFT_830884 [Paxillus rubicundulus Ve08.2h10]|uniref:Uncharacterized protein n=1 Tax=Paxillus rubicundulus Ve08.2h10 TaxID=930991 RepID=A0A0D0DY08_9AGAM|nr:hypothetical protein PAXRUDRAFT_830884 [Paxillus rubicundulus Ve08.2h10]